jgi:hypothetical protein
MAPADARLDVSSITVKRALELKKTTIYLDGKSKAARIESESLILAIPF